MSKQVEVAMSELSELLLDSLSRRQEVTLPITGVSMLPFLHPVRDAAVLTAADPTALQVGDVVLFRRDNGQYVLHRVHAVGKDGYTMLGDAQWITESISPLQVLAVATALDVDGRQISAADPAYRRRVARWRRLLPLRRVLLAIWRRLAR